MSAKSIILLLSILLLALFLRSKDIASNPPELFSDEIVNYVSARSIIEKGHDLEGRLHPYFSDRLELRPPAYGYFSYVSSRIFGENAIGIRAPAIFFGIVSIILVYLLTLEFFKDRDTALFAAFFMAIIPWHIHYSRVGWEPASFLPFLLLSTYLFCYGINRKKHSAIVTSFGIFTITIYTYQAAPLYSFLFLATLLILNRRYFLREWRVLLVGVLISALLLIPYIWTFINEPTGLYDRARAISTFSKGMNFESINTFLENYFNHFSPSFFFINGDPNLRHGAQTGTIYWAMLPFLLAGLVYLITSAIDRKVRIFIIFWIVIFPLAGALTNDGVPHATRSLAGAPVMCILSAFGAVCLVRSTAQLIGSKKYLFVLYTVVLYSVIVIVSLTSLLNFSKKYYYQYPKTSFAWWEYGYADIFSEIHKIGADYKRVCIEGLDYFHEQAILDYYARGSELKFINDINQHKCTLRGTILVQRSSKKKSQFFNLIKIIKAPNGKVQYYIYARPIQTEAQKIYSPRHDE